MPIDRFAPLAVACLQRFLRQNRRAELPAATAEAVCRGIWRVAVKEGLPRALGKGEGGEPGEMGAAEVNRLMAAAMEGISWPVESGGPETPVRQLLKACLQPEFKKCRESYREVVDGRCRRQQLSKARERISGSHCVDCPYWDSLKPEVHAAFLEKAWVENPGEFREHRSIFLPEDFRALRNFLGRNRREVKACESFDRPAHKDGGIAT